MTHRAEPLNSEAVGVTQFLSRSITQIMSMDCKNPLVYDELNKLIFEYLDINGLEKTLNAFTQECEDKSLPCPSPSDSPENKAAFSHYEGTKLMKAFDDGDLEGFFKLWRIFQSHIQVTSDDMAKLEVYIRVHFGLWPRAKNQPAEAQEKAMGELKQFFEQQKSSLGKDSAILPLYALPFVEDPYTHPIFKELFRDVWTMKLRTQLDSTIQKYFELLQENICQHSRLAELIVKGERYEEGNFGSTADVSGRGGYHQDRFYQLLRNHKKIRKLLQGTRESYAKLLLVTHELVIGLEQSISGQSGQPVAMEAYLDKCFYIFPEIFTPKSIQTAEQEKPNVEYFKQLSASANFDPTQDSEVSLFFLGISNVSPEFLDYEKMKKTLATDPTASVSDKLCLLQSLRWLITRTTENCRNTAVGAFVENDIFGIKLPKSDYRDKLFHCMVFLTPTYQKECLARFVNALSSTRNGRNYLASTTFTVDTLVKSLTTFTGPTESFICQMVVATLQKLSLKRSMRLYMIEHKVVNWLVIFIKKELNDQKTSLINNNITTETDEKKKAEKVVDQIGSFNPYLMEYAWALLMNLCLHEEAWESCKEQGADLLQCACEMLKVTPRKDLLPYVISTLYSLLRNPDMYKLANTMKPSLETLVAPSLTENNELSEHLKNLISLLHLEGCDRITSCRETNYDDEDSPDPDVFEPEIELSESWAFNLEESNLTGDDLLFRKYLIEQADPVIPCPADKKLRKPGSSGKAGEITRPMTPAKAGGVASSSKQAKRKKSQAQLVNESLGSPSSTNSTRSKPKKSPARAPSTTTSNTNNNGSSKPKPAVVVPQSQITPVTPLLDDNLEAVGHTAKADGKIATTKKSNTTVKKGSRRNSKGRENENMNTAETPQSPYLKPLGGKRGTQVSVTKLDSGERSDGK